MNCLIIDAKHANSKALEKVIEKSPHLKLIASCASIDEALEVFSKERIDLIFMEGQVEYKESEEFLEYINKNKLPVVAVSSVTEVGKIKFDFKVSDLMLKPFSNVQLNRIITKIISDQNMQTMATTDADSFIFIKANRTFHKIATSEITFVQALSDYVRIHTPSKVFTTYCTMKEMLTKLPQNDFLRVHRSYIVRIERISQFREGFVTVDKRLIPIGKLYKPS